MKKLLCLAALAALAAAASDLEVTVEIPRLSVAEYHRPYVAVWIESPDQAFVANLSVWYQVDGRGEKGTKWLKDLRSWWRKSGRELDMPVDGVSGATRPPGAHAVTFRGSQTELGKLKPGSYQLVVEAARETGGREIVRVPFEWPSATSKGMAQGTGELGQVNVKVKP